MAKGNNGNLLQHFVECQAASLLTRDMDDRRLFVVLTHGTAPSEPCEERRAGDPRGLREWLAYLRDGEPEARHPVLVAYNELGASEECYPNSAELIGAVLGHRSRLSGVVCEVEERKVEALRQAWSGQALEVHGASWRCADLCAPDDMDRPWLFSMDPYSYRERPPSNGADDGYLDDMDLCRLIPVLRSYLERRESGVICIFCYSLAPDRQRAFTEATERTTRRLAESASTCHDYVETPARCGNVHTGIIISSDAELPAKITSAWDEFPLRPGKKDTG